jgi:hypothetical protein
MAKSLTRRFLCWMTIVSLAIVIAASQPASADTPVKKLLTKKARIRFQYEQVATPEQREQMTKVQEEYKPKIEALENRLQDLKKQLKAMEKERDDKIAAILSADQKKKAEDTVKAKDAEAKAAKETTTKPAATAPSTPPATQPPAK